MGDHRHGVKVVVDPDGSGIPASAARATSNILGHCSAGSMPVRPSRQPCGTTNPKRVLSSF